MAKVATKIFELVSVKRVMRCIGEVFLLSKKDKLYHIPPKKKKLEVIIKYAFTFLSCLYTHTHTYIRGAWR